MVDQPTTQHRRQPASCLVWILFGLFILIVLGVVTNGQWRGSRLLAIRAKCAKQQTGIFAALMACQDEGQSGWPDARSKIGMPGEMVIPSGEPCARYTAAIFEMLADRLRDHVSAAMFHCPGQRDPVRRPDPEVEPSVVRPDTSWGWGTCRIPYAMDWSAPADAGAARVLLSDRDATNHRDGRVTVCHADGHYTTLPSQPAAVVPGVTRSIGYGDGIPPVRILAGGGEDQEPDDIYDDAGDAIPGRPEASRTPGGGHPRRAIMW